MSPENKIIPLKTIKKVIQCGLLSTFLQVACFNLFIILLPPIISNVIAFEIATLFAFFINNHYSFRDNKISYKHQSKLYYKKMLLFNVTALLSLLIQIGIIHFGIVYFGHGRLIYNGLLIAGVSIGFACNLFIYRYLIWRNQ